MPWKGSMNNLPTGTVAFLSTDIEDTTLTTKQAITLALED